MHRPQPKLLPMTSREKRQHRPRLRYQPLRRPSASLRSAVATTAGQIIATLAVTQLGVIAWDWAVSGPGPFVVFGL